MLTSQELFQRASGMTWGNYTIHIDHELGAVVLGVQVDNTRWFGSYATPEAALEFASKIAGAVDVLERQRQLRGEPR